MTPVRATFELERELWGKGFRSVAGVDEVGMGCLAGPIITAAVILPVEVRIDLLRDSKTLSAKQREKIAEEIKAKAVSWSIGEATLDDISKLNLHWADIEAMKKALASLTVQPDAVLSDGFEIPGLACYHKAIIKGDRKSRSIAAASIIAKVHRDSLMNDFEQQYPGYGFAQNKGYGTKVHLEALQKNGPCPIHRQSFAPVMMLKQGTLLAN